MSDQHIDDTIDNTNRNIGRHVCGLLGHPLGNIIGEGTRIFYLYNGIKGIMIYKEHEGINWVFQDTFKAPVTTEVSESSVVSIYKHTGEDYSNHISREVCGIDGAPWGRTIGEGERIYNLNTGRIIHKKNEDITWRFTHTQIDT